MEVMIEHDFFDGDIESVRMDGHPNNREIVLKETADNALLINKEDVIAFAKEFDLVVFDKSAAL